MSRKAKKNNHEVARAFLNRWATDHGLDTPQLAMLDARSGKVETRSIKAGFAVGRYLYVPKIDGEHDDRVEDWFGMAEQALVEFLRRNDARDFSAMTHQQWVHIVYGLVGLAHRGAHDVAKLREAVKADKSLQKKLNTSGNDHAIHHAVVENVVNRINRDVYRLLGGTLTILTDCTKEVLVCDRPAICQVRGEERTLLVPLGPSTLAVMDRQSDGVPVKVISETEHGVDSAKFVDMLNSFTIKRARRWVVGRDQAMLKDIAATVVQNAAEADEPVLYERISDEERDLLWSFGHEPPEE